MGRLRLARRQLTRRVTSANKTGCINSLHQQRTSGRRARAGHALDHTTHDYKEHRASIRCCCKAPHNVYTASVCLDADLLAVEQQPSSAAETQQQNSATDRRLSSAPLDSPETLTTPQPRPTSSLDALSSGSLASNDTPLDTPHASLASEDAPSPVSSTSSTLASLDEVLAPLPAPPSATPTDPLPPTTTPTSPQPDPPARHPNLSHFLPHLAFLSRFKLSLTSSPELTPAYPSPSPNAQQPTPQQDADSAAADLVKMWALAMMSMAYVHQSTATFAVPALLPIISPEMELDDFQGALLSSVPSYLYALALVPLGLLADRTHRPRLLAVSMALWSLLTIRTASSTSFPDLLTTRLAFATAQAAQNPICFSLIPELFPARKSFAMALYNTAVYVGRALAFMAVYFTGPASPLVATAGRVSTEMIPLDRLNLQKVSILYSSGSMAAVAPIYDYNYTIIEYAPHVVDHTPAWRHLLQWLGIPGLALAAMMLFTVPDPRCPPDTPWWQKGLLGRLLPRPAALPQPGAEGREGAAGGAGSLAVAGASAGVGSVGVGVEAGAAAGEGKNSMADTLKQLMLSPEFQLVTLAAAVNDMGSYALIAWHSTFYERVYGLAPTQYAPLLAAVLPIGGIVGGVGGGLAADWLDTKGCRYWLTVGATLAAAPIIAQSLLSPTVEGSFAALLIGAALSEAWRAPAAVAARSAAPSNSGSTASAVYLCIRNLVGGFGPLAVAQLAGPLGLQKALLLVPACFVGSGVLFAAGEALAAQRKRREELGAGGGDGTAP